MQRMFAPVPEQLLVVYLIPPSGKVEVPRQALAQVFPWLWQIALHEV